MTQYHSHALANLATATQSDRTTVANISKTTADLTLQLGQANAKLAEAQSSIAKLTSKLAKTGTRPNRPTTIPTGPIDMTTMAPGVAVPFHGCHVDGSIGGCGGAVGSSYSFGKF